MAGVIVSYGCMSHHPDPVLNVFSRIYPRLVDEYSVLTLRNTWILLRLCLVFLRHRFGGGRATQNES